MINISITATGIDETIKSLTKVAKGLGDHRDFLKEEVVPELKKEFRRVFSSDGFGRWRPLDRDTITQKLEDGYSTTPLVRTNYYKRVTERLQGMTIRRNVLEIDSPVPYAKYHEYGTRRIPARPVFSAVAQQIRPRLPRLYEIYARRKLRRELS